MYVKCVYFSEPHVRSHLKNVYASLTMTVLASTAGAYVHLFTDLLSGGGILCSLLAAGLAFGLFLTPDNGKNRSTRMGMLLGFGFLTGLGLGPLLQLAIMMNPSIVPTALLVTSTVFACFTGASLMAPDGKYLYLGGMLTSGLSTLLWLGFINIFFRSQMLFQVRRDPYDLSLPSLPICPGSYLDRPCCLLRVHHVRHSADHQESQEWRQGLHCPLTRSLHRLRAGVQEGSYSAHAEGKYISMDISLENL